jgi:branched-subunit amino acid ABC-type transport system permease component
MTELAQAIVNGLQMGFLYALVAVGLTIIWGLMEMINFAHGEFLMLGFGTLVYRLLMRRVQGGDPFTQIFATIGLLFLLQNTVVAGFTSDYRFVGNSWLTRLSGVKLQIFGITFGVPLLAAAGLALLLFLALYLLIERTAWRCRPPARTARRPGSSASGRSGCSRSPGASARRSSPSPAPSSSTSSPCIPRWDCSSRCSRMPSSPSADSGASWARCSPPSSWA